MIAEFILARVGEREADVVTAGDVIDCEYATGLHLLPHEVKAECEALRRIVQLHPQNLNSCDTCTNMDYVGLVDDWPCPTMKAVASIWADHPDFREEWSATPSNT